MGAWLARQRPGIRAIRISYGSGHFYNAEPRQFARRADPQGKILISYQNDRKGCAMIAGKVENVSEHAAACIGMLTDQ